MDEVLSMNLKKYIRAFWPTYLIAAVLLIAAAAGGSRAVTTIAESIPVPREHIFIIDAGHGGEDGGATSCTGLLESQYNLEIALRLNDLMRLLGYETVMIRTTDISVYTEGTTIAAKKVSDLKQRVKTVNETENAILVSIHQNSFPDGRYSGAQVFYNGVDGSQTLARELQSDLVRHLNPGSSRKCKSADGIYLMQHIRRPGVLIECGFLTNPEEEAMLRSPEYQKKLCCVLAASLGRCLNA